VRSIEALPPGDYDAYDVALAGFAVRVRSSGSKSFILRYRPKGGGRAASVRTMTLGKFPALRPELAREMAQRHLGEIAAGRDPARERPKVVATRIGDVLADYLASLEGRPSHRVARYDVKLHLMPALGAKLVADLTATDVERLRDRLIAAGKRRRAGAVVTLLRAALRRAGLDDTPAKVKAPGHRRRRRVASLDELAAIFTACRELLQEGRVWPWAIYLVMLVLFTGARPAEIRTARWADVRGNRIVRSDHKTARETGEEREIELPPPAVRLLQTMPRLASNPYLIPGKAPGEPLLNYAPAWAAITKRAGVEGLWLYDGRRTFASIGLGLGFTLPQLARSLGHNDLATIDAYTWLLPSDQKTLTGQVAEVLEKAAAGRSSAGPTGGRGPSGSA
jgi:integrase